MKKQCLQCYRWSKKFAFKKMIQVFKCTILSGRFHVLSVCPYTLYNTFFCHLMPKLTLHSTVYIRKSWITFLVKWGEKRNFLRVTHWAEICLHFPIWSLCTFEEKKWMFPWRFFQTLFYKMPYFYWKHHIGIFRPIFAQCGWVRS